MLRPGGFGAGGAALASEAGLAVAGGGGTFATAGGFGIDTLPGIPGGGGGGELTAPGAPAPAAEDGLGQVARPPESTEASAEQAALAFDHQPEKVPVVSGSRVGPAMAAGLKWIQGVSEPAWGVNLSSRSPANLTKVVDHLGEGGERCAQFPSWAQT